MGILCYMSKRKNNHAIELAIAIILLFLPLVSAAQNNQYKIADNLFDYYQRAQRLRATPKCLAVADSMYHKAMTQGDHKAVCLSFIPKITYYLYAKNEEEHAKECAKMEHYARQCGLLQYAYYALSSRCTIALNKYQYLIALQRVEDMYRKATADNFPYGIVLALRGRANLFYIQCDYKEAEVRLREALEYMKEHVKDQDLAPLYSRLSMTLLQNNKVEESIRYSKEALGCIMNPENTFTVVYGLLIAYYEKQELYRQEFLDTYKKYEQVILNTPRHNAISKEYVMVLKALLEDDVATAEKIVEGATGETLSNAKILLAKHKGDYKKAYELYWKFNQKSIYTDRNESPVYQVAEFNASFAQSKLQRDNALLEFQMAEQQLLKVKAEAELENKLHENMMMQLANDSLAIEKMKADSMKLAVEKESELSEMAIVNSRREQKIMLTYGLGAAVLLLFSFALLALWLNRRYIKRLKSNQTTLAEALDHAKEAERLKSGFVKNISYDIRTPLNAVVGFSDILLTPGNELSEDDKDVIKRKIEQSSTTLTTLLGDILNLSYIESGRQKVEKAEENLPQLLLAATSSTQGDYKPGVTVRYAEKGNETLTINTDKHIFNTAMNRLLTFATHHTDDRLVNVEHELADGHSAGVSITYKTTEWAECGETMFNATQYCNEDMEPYKRTLSVARAAISRLGGSVRFVKAAEGFAKLLVTHPLRLVTALVVVLLSSGMPQTARAQFTKDRLDPETYKIYIEAQNKRDLKEGLDKARELYRLGESRGNKYVQCVGLGVELQHHVMNGNDTEAFSTIARLQDLASQIHDTIYYYMAFSNEIAIHLNNHKTLTALKRCTQERDHAQRKGDKYGEYTCNRSLGDIYRVRKNYHMSRVCYDKAIGLFRINHITHDPTMTFLRLCDMCLCDRDYDACRDYLNEARKHIRVNRYVYLADMEEAFIAFHVNDTSTFNRMYDKVADMKEKHGYRYPDKEQKMEIYRMLIDGERDKAISIAQEAFSPYQFAHLLVTMHINRDEWKEACETAKAEKGYRMLEEVRTFERDRAEMNDIIGINSLEADNLRLRLEAARLDIVENKARAELEKSLTEKQELLNANNRLTLSRLMAEGSLDSASYKKSKMTLEQRKVQELQTSVFVVVVVALAILLFLFVVIYLVLSLRYAHHLEKKNKEIKEAKVHAEHSDRMKTMFIQNMSHEIRTPLNAIVGFSQLMLSPDIELDDDERQEFARTIRHNSELLTTLVGDIISLSELESGRYEIQLSDTNVNGLCLLALKTVEHKRRRDVDLRFETNVDNSFVIKTDTRRVEQVLINYLTNAIKYTQKGSITLGCDYDRDKKTVTFSVTDTGQGIPLEKQKEIFERFSKLDNFHQGTGLGLNICNLIAEKLGGTVGVDSTYTGGARFLFTLNVE